MPGYRYLAATPMKPSAIEIGTHSTAAMNEAERAASGLLVEEMA